MAIGVGTDFKIYNETINGAAFEVVAQFIDVMNERSRGAIQLRSEGIKGDYNYESFFLEGADVERRDPDSTGDLEDVPILQDELVGVKIHRRFHRALTRNQWLRVGQNPDQFARIYGGQLARKMMREEVNTCIAAAAAAVAQVAALNHDATDGVLAHGDLISGLSKFGDAADEIVCWVVHSKAWFDLVGGAIASSMLEVGRVAVFEGSTGTAGKPVIITDSPALKVAGSPAHYVTLGLVRGAVSAVESESQFTADSGMLTGKNNIYRRLQTEWAYNLIVKGCKYDTQAGKNPDATAVATSTNWDKVVTDNKSMPGVRIVSQ